MYFILFFQFLIHYCLFAGHLLFLLLCRQLRRRSGSQKKQMADKSSLLFLQRRFFCDRYFLFVTGEYLLKLTFILLLCK